MPYLRIQTNQAVDSPEGLMTRASSFLAEQLGKPESYIMVAIEPECPLMFNTSTEPAAYVELKSIGLSDSQTADLSRAVCGFLQEELGVEPRRTYVEFTGVPGSLWGWDNRTFG